MLQSLFGFDSVGKKIKSICRIIFYVAVFLTFAGGIALAVFGLVEESAILAIVGVALALLGPVLSYLSCLLFYGFGEIVDNVVSINNKSAGTTDKNQYNAELPDL